MKVSLWRSIGVKLFLLIALTSAFTVAGVTFLNSNVFRRHLERETRAELLAKAQGVAGTVSTILGNWMTQASLLTNNLANQSDTNKYESLSTLVQANKDFFHIDVFEQTAEGLVRVHSFFTPNLTDAQFLEKDPQTVKSQLEDFNKKVFADKKFTADKKSRIVNTTGVTGLSTLQLVLPFENKKDGESIWIALSLWSANLLKALPHSDTNTSVIVQAPNRIVAAHSFDLMKKDVKSLNAGKFIEDNLKKSPGTVFRSYDDPKTGEPIFGVLTPVGKFDLVLLVEQNAHSLLASIDYLMRKSFLWGVFFVLIAVLLSFLSSQGVSRTIGNLTQAAVTIAQGNLNLTVPVTRKDELGVLTFAINVMARRIRDLIDKVKHTAHLEKDLETAEAVQTAIFPRTLHFEGGVTRCVGHCQSMTQVGGDWWGFFQTKEGHELVLLGDATGHGVSAALVTTMVYASTTSYLAQIAESNEELKPGQLLSHINKVLWEAGRGKTTMTMFALLVRPQSKDIIFANGGHHFPYVFTPGAGTKPKILNAAGPVLGSTHETTHEQSVVQVNFGQKIVLYSDGATECHDEDGKVLGSRKFVKFIESMIDHECKEICQKTFEMIKTYVGRGEATDDITVVFAEIVDPRAASAPEPSGEPGMVLQEPNLKSAS